MSIGKSFHIEIENHCQEDFSKMTPDAQGRFCSACQKTVIDFSVLNDDEIIDYFKKYSTQKTCGRFTIEQMSKEYFFENPKSNFRFTWMRKMVAALFLLPLSISNAFAQKKIVPHQHKTQQKKIDKQIPQIIIEGTVQLVDVNVPIEFVEVQIDSFKTKTDEQGKFQFCLPISMMNDSVKIVCKTTEDLVIEDYELNISRYISYNKKIKIIAIPKYNVDEISINIYKTGGVISEKRYFQGGVHELKTFNKLNYSSNPDKSDSIINSLKLDLSKFVLPLKSKNKPSKK